VTRQLVAFLLLTTSGCSTTTFGPPNTPARQKWIERHGASEMRVVTDRGTGGGRIVIAAGSPTEIEFRHKDGSVVPLEQIRKLEVVHQGLGALEGALIGAATGAAIGMGYGLSRDLSRYESSMDCTIVCNNADAAKWAALTYGALGLLLGTVTGAAIGDREILELR
jgi:hypothetical protein